MAKATFTPCEEAAGKISVFEQETARHTETAAGRINFLIKILSTGAVSFDGRGTQTLINQIFRTSTTTQ